MSVSLLRLYLTTFRAFVAIALAHYHFRVQKSVKSVNFPGVFLYNPHKKAPISRRYRAQNVFCFVQLHIWSNVHLYDMIITRTKNMHEELMIW